MSWVAVAVTAVGAGVSAYGASKSANAIGDANRANSGSEDELFDRQSKKLNKLTNAKDKKLKDLGNIFDRFESTGAFGNTDTLKNLRTAQEDFSQLAAGDFTGFESQLRKSMSDTLINTFGSGAPIGTFAGLAADQQMDFRKEGITQTLGISDYLSQEAFKLLGSEFGIMDQRFNTQYEMDRNRVTNMNNYALGMAGTIGVKESAMGGAVQTIGSGIYAANMGRQTMAQNQQQLDIAQGNANAMKANSPTSFNTSASKVSATSSWGSSAKGGSVPGGRIPMSGLPSTIYSDFPPEHPMDNGFNFKETYDSIWTPSQSRQPSYEPSWDSEGRIIDDGMVLPPLTKYSSYGSALASVGARIAQA